MKGQELIIDTGTNREQCIDRQDLVVEKQVCDFYNMTERNSFRRLLISAAKIGDH